MHKIVHKTSDTLLAERELILKLSNGDPEILDELRHMFVRVHPGLFIGDSAKRVHLVASSLQEDISTLLGEEVVSLSESIRASTQDLIIPEAKLYVAETPREDIELSHKEFQLLVSNCFLDKEAFVFFTTEFNYFKSQSYFSNAMSVREMGEERSYEAQDVSTDRMTGNIASQSNVIPLIKCEKRFQKQETKTTYQTRSAKLHHDIDEVIISSILFIAYHESFRAENITWYVGATQNYQLSDVAQAEISRIKELEIYGGLMNYSEHMESLIAMMIGYNFPHLRKDFFRVSNPERKIGAEFQKRPSLSDPEFILS